MKFPSFVIMLLALIGHTVSSSATSFLKAPDCQGCIGIPTYVHLILPEEGPQLVPDDLIITQIDILNKEFGETPFMFELIGITKTVDLPAFQTGEIQGSIYGSLKEGGRETLNIFVSLQVGSLGAKVVDDTVASVPSAMPLGISAVPELQLFHDFPDFAGIQYATLPGSRYLFSGYFLPSLGKVLVHEVGHWMGLYHIFPDGVEPIDPFDDLPLSHPMAFTPTPEAVAFIEQNCARGESEGGDFVDDTPLTPPVTDRFFYCTAPPSLAIPPPLNCPGSVAPPTNNHMDYLLEQCSEEFTPGQVDRMYQQWVVFRSPLDECKIGRVTLRLNVGADSHAVSYELVGSQDQILFSSTNNGGKSWQYLLDSETEVEFCLPDEFMDDVLTFRVTIDPSADFPIADSYQLYLDNELITSVSEVEKDVELSVVPGTCKVECPTRSNRVLVCEVGNHSKCVREKDFERWWKRREKGRSGGREYYCGACSPDDDSTVPEGEACLGERLACEVDDACCSGRCRSRKSSGGIKFCQKDRKRSKDRNLLWAMEGQIGVAFDQEE